MATGMVAGKLYADDTPAKTKQAKPALQALWVVDGSGRSNISIFQGSRLGQKTGIVASGGVSATANDEPLYGLTFDSSNDLWLSFCGGQNASGYVAELTARSLRALANLGSAEFKIIIEDPSAEDSSSGPPEYLACPRGMAVDQSGNLWVETSGAEETSQSPALLEYASIQLTLNKDQKKLQALVPSGVIETPAIQTSFGPVLAFDKAGNLWQSGGVISEQSPGDEEETVVEYTAAQLGTPASNTEPNQTLIVADTSVSGALNAPSSITFDANGNLWVAFALGGTGNTGGVEMIAAADLSGEGTSTPSPAVTLGPATLISTKAFGTLQSFANPDGLAFDNEGDLWVANQSKQAEQASKVGSGSIVEFTPSQLTASGSPVPVRGILANKKDTNLGAPIYATFGPALP